MRGGGGRTPLLIKKNQPEDQSRNMNSDEAAAELLQMLDPTPLPPLCPPPPVSLPAPSLSLNHLLNRAQLHSALAEDGEEGVLKLLPVDQRKAAGRNTSCGELFCGFLEVQQVG